MQTQKTATELSLRPGRSEDAQLLGEICYNAFASIADAHKFPRDFPSSEIAAGLMTMMLSRPDIIPLSPNKGARLSAATFFGKAMLSPASARSPSIRMRRTRRSGVI